MASDNGKKEDRVKKCPFLNEDCIQDNCALWAEMTRQAGGLQQKFGMCSFSGVMMLLSEINQKTQVQQQKVNIPNLIRG